MVEPLLLRNARVERVTPFLVTPARAANENRLLKLGEGRRATRFAFQSGGMHFGSAFDIISALLLAAQLASCAPLLAAEKRPIIFFLRARHDPVSDL